MQRRSFLFSAAAATPATAHSLRSANDTIRVACVGLRGQGNSHIRSYLGMKNVEIAALVDIDQSVLERRVSEVEKASGKRPAALGDIRKALEDKSIDAISIATPNHSHAVQTIWSCQAGKHVYIEKPCSHNVFESRQVVAAARKYDRIVQHGTNSRSTEGLREAVERLKGGVIGDVYLARGLCYKWRDTIKSQPDSAVPAGVDYDQWLGPAPKRAFSQNRFHYNWHWWWDYGNGDFGNQGIHELDICRWGLGVKLPVKVSAIGAKVMFDDDQETPNVLMVNYEFDAAGKKKLMTFEVRHWITNHESGIGGEKPGNTVGNLFYGSNGYMAIDGYTKYWTYVGRTQTPGPAKAAGGSNWVNFIDALRAGKREMLNGEIEEGALSSTLMHLGNISYRLGRTLNIDPVTGDVKNDPQAQAMFTRKYRAPYVVPQKV